jgi:DNA-binding response OmpR family regulator
MTHESNVALNILVAERDAGARQLVASLLERETWQVDGVADSRGLYLGLLDKPVHILIIGPDFPAEGGVAVIRQLRGLRDSARMGIIMLAKPGSALAIEALLSGADACIARPVDREELKAYVRTIERRITQTGTDPSQQLWTYVHNEWKLISPSGANIVLSHLESSFVHMIARHAGRPVRRRDIISQAFGQDPLHYDNRRLEALVSRLRKKVHRCYPLSQPIKVVHSIGYVFTDAIKCIELPHDKQ